MRLVRAWKQNLTTKRVWQSGYAMDCKSIYLGSNPSILSNNTDTQEMLMSKNPYEVRLETLKMAKEMVDQQFNLQMDLMFNMIDQAKESGENVKDAYDKYVPDMYKPEHVIDKAQELYKYVSEKK